MINPAHLLPDVVRPRACFSFLSLVQASWVRVGARRVWKGSGRPQPSLFWVVSIVCTIPPMPPTLAQLGPNLLFMDTRKWRGGWTSAHHNHTCCSTSYIQLPLTSPRGKACCPVHSALAAHRLTAPFFHYWIATPNEHLLLCILHRCYRVSWLCPVTGTPRRDLLMVEENKGEGGVSNVSPMNGLRTSSCWWYDVLHRHDSGKMHHYTAQQQHDWLVEVYAR